MGGQRAALPAPDVPAVADTRQIQRLMKERTVSGTEANYRIREGDVLALEVLGVNELAGTFRVSELGRVALPLVRPVAVKGLTVKEATAELRGALGQYLQDPVIKLAVSKRSGAHVAVMGAVGSPGSYPLEGFDETLADLITRAGGMTRHAGPTLFLFPSGSAARQGSQLASTGGTGLIAGSQTPGAGSVEIDLTRLYRGRSVPELNLPLRPGDAILIPVAGEVFVNGWVYRPGSFAIQTRMTLTEALAKAGGLHFGASRSAMKLIRVDPAGEPTVHHVSYSEAISNTSMDPYLQAGDRLEVPPNPLRAGGWALWWGIRSLFGFHAGARVIPVPDSGNSGNDRPIVESDNGEIR